MKKDENIIFVGLMGSGKTTIGRRLASILNYDFIDTDHEIERITGRTVKDIFKKEGELRFRSEETLVLKRILGSKKTIISTGGGIILKKENRDLIKKMGFVIYLKADVPTILERVGKGNKRPLLSGNDLRSKVEELYEQRKNIYEELSDLTISSDSAPFEKVIAQILKVLRNK